jgi:hypothetical protein
MSINSDIQPTPSPPQSNIDKSVNNNNNNNKPVNEFMNYIKSTVPTDNNNDAVQIYNNSIDDIIKQLQSNKINSTNSNIFSKIFGMRGGLRTSSNKTKKNKSKGVNKLLKKHKSINR